MGPLAGTGRVALRAGHDLTVGTQSEQDNEAHLRQEKKSGLMSSGGIGFSYGTQRQKTTDTGQEGTQQGSTIGSVNGDLTLQAGNNLGVTGSDLIAGQNLLLQGKNVTVEAARNQSVQTHEVEQKTSGLTLALSGAAGSALNSVVETTQQAKSAGNNRLGALQGVKAALSGVQAGQAVELDAAKGSDPKNDNAIGVNLSYGSQSSTSSQRSEQNTAQGSSLSAGKNIAVVATGNGVKGEDGDVTIQGSSLKAGSNVLLQANRDINLQSAENTQSLDSKNASQGGSVGVGIGVGSGGWGINVSASVNKGKGNEKGNGTTHNETTVDAGQQVTLISGRDANLTGAQVNGEKIAGDIGRNLTLTSEQDTDRYDSKQQNASAGGSFSFGSMSGSASVNASQDKMKSNFNSVAEQTGLFAGKGGYDINVGGHTQLNGAVISSTATPDKNILNTATLGFSDIQNQAEYKTSHQGVGFSTGGSIGKEFAGNAANTLLSGINSGDSTRGTTKSAISPGTITVRDTANQQQDISTLSRDTEHANGSISPIFDKQKEQERLQAVAVVGDIGNQVSDIARTNADINALNAGKAELATKEGRKEPGPGATKQDWKNYNEAVANTASYKAEEQKGGTGSATQQAIQSLTAAATGLTGDNLQAAIAGGAAPYLAEQIKENTPDGPQRIMAHALLGGAVAAASGNNALSGAAAAGGAELAAPVIAKEMFGADTPEKIAALSETDKQTISALSTAAAGLAGGVIGDSSANAVAGAQAGKNAVENNYLSKEQVSAYQSKLESCGSNSTCQQNISAEAEQTSRINDEKMKAICGADSNSSACKQAITDSTWYAASWGKGYALQGDIERSSNELFGVVIPMNDGYKYYPALDERKDFFQAMQNQLDTKGNEVVWFQSAADVSDTLSRIQLCPAGCFGTAKWIDTVGQSIMKGGWSSFQNIYNQPQPLTGDKAKQWDTTRLNTEQNSTQRFYDELNKTDSFAKDIIKNSGKVSTGNFDRSVFEEDFRKEYGQKVLEDIRNNRDINSPEIKK